MSESPENEAQLLPCQLQAIENIRNNALAAKEYALEVIEHVYGMSNINTSDVATLGEKLKRHAHVAIHFHPDRPVGRNSTVAESLLKDGIYKSQFESNISNGLVSTNAGGPRDTWERNLFGGAYHDNGKLAAQDRPKYGALDLVGNSDGPAPRFGSCYFILKSKVAQRTTFTFGGSQANPSECGTIDEMDAIFAAILDESFTRDSTLGLAARPARLIQMIQAQLTTPRKLNSLKASGNLDHMIEAQIHGQVLLGRDIEALVVDGSFANERCSTGDVLREMGRKYNFPVHFTAGFSIPVNQVPDDFRGPTMPGLAARVALGDSLDARAIGVAAQDLISNPKNWADRGNYEAVVQEIKLLWHVLVRYG